MNRNKIINGRIIFATLSFLMIAAGLVFLIRSHYIIGSVLIFPGIVTGFLLIKSRRPNAQRNQNKSTGQNTPRSAKRIRWYVLIGLLVLGTIFLVVSLAWSLDTAMKVVGIIMITTTTLGVSVVGGLALIYVLAEYNILFTMVEEGQIKAVTKFGKFHELIMVYENHYFDQFWNVRHKGEDGKKDWHFVKIEKDGGMVKEKKSYKIHLRKPKSELPGGIFWIGLPFIFEVFTYHFIWDSFRQDTDDSGKIVERIVHHDEWLDYILAQDAVYFTLLEGAEAKGMVPLNIQILLTIRILNPYKALFRVQKWLEQTVNIARPVIRTHIASKVYEALVAAAEGGELQKTSEGFLSKMADEILEDYGVKIKKIGFPSLDPTATERGVDFIKAASQAYVAEKEADAVRIRANAEKDRQQTVYKATIELGEAGMTIRGLEAIEGAGKGGGNWVIPFDSMSGILRSVLGTAITTNGTDEKKGTRS
ncbi:MAG: SPFH domain-containing protein [Patescibacteria group bacterium]